MTVRWQPGPLDQRLALARAVSAPADAEGWDPTILGGLPVAAEGSAGGHSRLCVAAQGEWTGLINDPETVLDRHQCRSQAPGVVGISDLQFAAAAGLITDQP